MKKKILLIRSIIALNEKRFLEYTDCWKLYFYFSIFNIIAYIPQKFISLPIQKRMKCESSLLAEISNNGDRIGRIDLICCELEIILFLVSVNCQCFGLFEFLFVDDNVNYSKHANFSGVECLKSIAKNTYEISNYLFISRKQQPTDDNGLKQYSLS